jgi:hypothetical protein
MIWFVALAFLRCWALIFFTFITCFQWDDHLIILNAMVHVKLALFPFSWHYQIPKLYYPMWFILMSPPLKIYGTFVSSLISLFDKPFTSAWISILIDAPSDAMQALI